MTNHRRGDFLVPFLTVASDVLAIEAAFLFAYWLRFRSWIFDSLGFLDANAPPISGYLAGSAFVILIWLLLFNARKMYGGRRNVNLFDEFVNVVKVVSMGMLIVMSAAFFYREFSYSRVVIGLLWATAIVFITFGRAAVLWLERRLYRKGRNIQEAILVGSDSLANQVYSRLDRHPSFGIHIIGYFADAPAHEELTLTRASYLGPVSGAPEYIQAHGIELAFLALRSQDHAALFDLITACEGLTIEFMMVPDVLELLTSQVKVRELEGVPFLRIKGIPLTAWGRITKRTFDLLVSALFVLLLSPLMLVIALLIRLDSKGPLLFRQKRVGLDGREFTMYKFRSMVPGAERFDLEAGLGVRNDPRRTQIGKFLRMSSMDELPQLFNVLKGEMSLVGPRPERTHIVKEFQDVVPKYLDRHRVKTGVTGWAQVNGLRGDTSIGERIKYDLYYVENWSLTFDVKILLRTIRAALTFRESR